MNEKYVIPEIHSNAEWYFLTNRKSFLSKREEDKIKSNKALSLVEIKENQLLLIDVFTNWSGPCIAVESHLRRWISEQLIY